MQAFLINIIFAVLGRLFDVRGGIYKTTYWSMIVIFVGVPYPKGNHDTSAETFVHSAPVP